MPITFYCASCGKKLRAPDNMAGEHVPCPNCGKRVEVPGAEEEAAEPSPLAELSDRALDIARVALERLRPIAAKATRACRRLLHRRPKYTPIENEEGELEEFAAKRPGPGRLANLDLGVHRAAGRSRVWATRLVVLGIMALALYTVAVSGYALARQVYNGGDYVAFVRDLLGGRQPRPVMWRVASNLAMTILGLVLLAGAVPALRLMASGRRQLRAALAAMVLIVLAHLIVPMVPSLGIGRQDAMSSGQMILYGTVGMVGLLALGIAQLLFGYREPGEHNIIDLVDRLLSEALRVGASDVHVEPALGATVVRYRIDGVLYAVAEYPPNVADKAVARIKVLGSMDIAEKRMPQDGGAKMNLADRTVDLRISTVPSEYGERAVVRLLDPVTGLMGFEALGLDEHLTAKMDEIIASPNGVFFCTGPTGSGKTTTLYAALMRANRKERNVITVEDPIEYRLPGIAQLPVGRKKGMNFASGLRSILRQDPDVIMVGEVRDEETARMVVEAAQTGHLVMSTMHTNDSAGAVTRLLDLGVEPFLLASCLTAVLAQRLVRCVCPQCRQPYQPDEAELRDLGLKTDARPTFYKGRGCTHCMDTGYRGRIGLFELLVIDEEIRKLVTQGVDAGTIRQRALQRGMRDLRADGARKVMQGITTYEEVKRVTHGQLAF